MPTYEYKCRKCGNTFELSQSMTSKPKAKCPKCAGSAKRLIGNCAGIIFKGSGFYETDYKRKSPSGKDISDKKDPACSMNKDCKSCPGPKG